MKIRSFRIKDLNLGGKTFLDRRVYAALTPFFLLNSVLVSNHEPTLINWLLLGLINLVSLACCFGVFEIAARTIFRHRETIPVTISAIFFFGLALGAFKGFTTAFIAFTWGFENNLVESIQSRIFQTSILGALVVIGISAISFAQEQYQTERDLLVAERVQQLMQQQKQPDSAANSQKILRDFVAKAKTQLKRNSNPPSEMIREIVEVGLRPLSHKLWERENSKYLNFGWAELAKFTILNNKFLPYLSAGIYFVSTLPLVAYYGGWKDGVERSVLGAFVIAALLSLAKKVKCKSLARAVAFYVSIQVATAALVVWLSTALLGSLGQVNPVSVTVAISVLLIQVNLLVGIAELMNESHKSVRQGLATLVSAQGIDRDVARTQNLLANRELANYLHGSLQNKLLSAAVRIEQSGNDPHVLITELEQVEKLLDSVDDSGRIISTEALNLQIEALANSWKGFVNISISSNSKLTTGDQSLDTKLAQVVNEGVSNAVRHGLAKNIVVELTRVESSWKIRVIDDGLGPKIQTPGLGSKFFSSIAGSNWRLEAQPIGGSILTLEVI